MCSLSYIKSDAHVTLRLATVTCATTLVALALLSIFGFLMTGYQARMIGGCFAIAAIPLFVFSALGLCNKLNET